jgi:threonine-phosphate decarboxylase
MALPYHINNLAPDFSANAENHFRTLLKPLDLQREHGGNVFAWARRVGLDPEEMTDFSASTNPLGPPPIARRAFLKSCREISRYPDVEVYELKEALARCHRVKPEEVLLGNGSTQLIYLLCRALRPRKGLVVIPAFSEYGNALRLVGAKVQSYSLLAEDGFTLPLQEFMKRWEKDLDMIYLSNPNSVTGQMIPRGEIKKIARLALKNRIFLIVDEAFMDFVESESVKELIRWNPYLVVLRSLTKYYGIPGMRIGYLLAQRTTVDLLALHQEPWSVNRPAQTVALACLKDATFRLKTSGWLEHERAFLMNGLASMKGIHPYPSRANFVLVGLDEIGANALELRSFLLRQGILIRTCDSFLGLGSDYFRVAVRLRRDNVRLLKALKDFVGYLRPSH